MANFSIRSSTLRLGLFVSTLAIAAIIVFQLVWLKQTYHLEQKEFDYSVIKAIKGLYEDIDANVYYSSHLNELIESPEPHLYLVRMPLPVSIDSVAEYLHYELEGFGVFTECHLGIYSTQANSYIHTRFLPSTSTKHKVKPNLPATPRPYDHLTLYFPNRGQFILSQLNFWIVSSAILLLVLLLFGAGVYYFYRQKFLNETQKDFIHNFAHEFKTPVSIISLAADVLKNPDIKPDKLLTYSAIVEYQSGYLNNQIDKLLKFAYTESRRLHIEKKRVNLHELIREAVSNLAPLIDERKTKLELHLDASDPFLEADKDYLVIVITNLIDNGIKYSKEPHIIIRTANKGTAVMFSVRDNGIGIEKKQLRKIFRKFFRVRQGETYTAKGFGIGLSFVKKIVDGHNGKIIIESKPGEGSEFTVELPSL